MPFFDRKSDRKSIPSSSLKAEIFLKEAECEIIYFLKVSVWSCMELYAKEDLLHFYIDSLRGALLMTGAAN